MFTKSAFASLVLLASAAFSAPLAPRAASSKRGLCFRSDFDGALPLFNSPKISWAYNWGDHHWGSTPLPSNMEYVPMCWGPKQGSWAECEAIKSGVLSGQSTPTHVLGFNEPDIPGQAYMSVGDAVANWHTYMQPLAAKGVKLGAPSISNSEDADEGINWLRPFLSACKDCTFDFFPVHWFSSGRADIEYFKSCITRAHDTILAAGHPGRIWVTELGVRNVDTQTQLNFMREAIQWMEGQNWIQRYAYYAPFPAEENMQMVTGYGNNLQLNSVGSEYLAL